jgi:hypothetical protein
MGFTQSVMDPSLTTSLVMERGSTSLNWVDGIILLGSASPSVIGWFRKELAARYKVKDLEAGEVIGMSVHWKKEAAGSTFTRRTPALNFWRSSGQVRDASQTHR